MSKIKKFLKIVIVILIVVVVAVGGIRLLKKRKEEVANLPKPQIPVYMVNGTTVKSGEIEIKREFVGLLRPVNTVELTTKLSAYVKKIHVKTNQKVKKGDLLVSLDDIPIRKEIQNSLTDIQSLKTQLKALKAERKAVEIDLQTKINIYNRDKRLYEKKAISKEALEKSQSIFEKVKAQLEGIKANIEVTQMKIKQLENKIAILKNDLSYLEIRSPINGIVQRINIREGNLVVPGKPVLNLESSDKYEIIVRLPPDFPVYKGDQIIVDFNGIKKKLKVSMICPSASPEALKIIKARIHSKPKGVISNSYLNVTIPKKIKGLIVPVNSLLHLTDGTYILTFKNEKFEKIPVKVIDSNENYVVIEGNIEEGIPIAVAEESKLKLLALGKKGKILLKEQQ